MQSNSLSEIDGATVHSTVQIGRNDYQVMWKDDSFGLFRGNYEDLPFKYDFIDIDYENGLFYLLKDKKMGVFIHGSSYSIIEPKYGLISFHSKLRVSKKWTFALFSVKSNGQEGYIGENGVEFFNFD